MDMKALRVGAVLAAALLLGGCRAPGGIIATVDGETVLTGDRLRQEAALVDKVLPIDATDQDAVRERYVALARQLTYEALIARDRKLSVDATAEAVAANDAVQARFGDAAGLQVQLDAFGVSAGELSGTLSEAAKASAHVKAFLAASPTTTDDIDRYIAKHPKEAALVSYTEITVPTRKEANEVKAALEADATAAVKGAEKYNRDLFEATTLGAYRDIAYDDARVPDEDLFAMAVGETEIFYQSDPRRYRVVHLDGKKDSRPDVEEHVRAVLDRERYLAYVNQLAKDHQLRFFEDEIVLPAEESGAVSSASE
ncbi:MAG: hypothetical protein SPI19_00295 [Peptoniphilaceae bacterium]|nr:hypothetical protein [Peptoniphilaceae bacterium]